MRFIIKALFDITETRCRKGDNLAKVRQQQNYLSVINTIGLRVNPTYISEPTSKKEPVTQFGSNYTGKHNVWTYKFDVDYEGALDIATMINDFDLCPIITNLDETAKIEPAIIRSKCSKNMNIIFMEDDK